jgi:hypothetical protein
MKKITLLILTIGAVAFMTGCNNDQTVTSGNTNAPASTNDTNVSTNK